MEVLLSYVLVFGLAGSALHFIRIPAFLIAFCRRLFAIAVTGFCDDHRIVEHRGAQNA